MISAATPRIENSYIYESQTAGIYIIGANPQVVGCRFADNYRALDIRGRATAPGITGNQIEPQDNTPVIIDARCVPDIVSNNTFTARLDGKLNAIQLWETTIGTSMTWPVPPPGFVYLYSTNDGYSNPRPIVIGGTGSPVLTLLPGTIVKLYEEACLQVGNTGAPGGLKANGVIFTSMRDNQGGDTDGTATAAATGDWNYVNLSATAVSDSCVFTNCEFRYGGNNGSAGMLMISAGTPRITACDFASSATAGLRLSGTTTRPILAHCGFSQNPSGLRIVSNARPSIDNCCFSGNSQYGLNADAYSDGQGVLLAQNCWWGSTAGPRTGTTGAGDRVTTNVSYSPWADYQVCETSVSSVGDLPEVVRNFQLAAPYPNPFNPTTTFEFAMPQTERVRLAIYDLSGRLVRVLVDEQRPAGTYDVQWNGMDDRGQRAASGVYLCRMEAGSFVSTKRMTMLK